MSGVEILGLCVDSVSYDELLVYVDAWVASGRPHQIVTLNTEMLVMAHDDAGLCQTLNQTDLIVADAAGLVLAARLLGQPLRERITGSDGIHRLSAHCAQRGYRPFFLGAAPGVAEIVAQQLASTYGELEVAGTYAGSPRIEDEAKVIKQVREAKPDLLFVAYGVPAEEKWIARNRDRLGVPVMIGVGGSFDFVAGVTKRAPVWMRRVGLEWLYRLMREPWRWRRQLALPRFLVLLFKQRWKGMRGSDSGSGNHHKSGIQEG